jgi:hypothetical protein
MHEIDSFLLGQVQAMGCVRRGGGHSDTLGEAVDHTDALAPLATPTGSLAIALIRLRLWQISLEGEFGLITYLFY